MATTVVEAAGRTYGESGYTDGRVDPQPRLRRPAWLQGMHGDVVLPDSGPDLPLQGLGAGPCPAGHTFRTAAGQCFCDPLLQGLGGFGYAIPCPPPATSRTTRRQARARRAVVNRVFQPVPDRVITQPSVVTARVAQQKAAITYKAPAADVSPGPDMPPPPPADEETPILPPPPEGELPHKAMPGWIPYAAAGGLAVVFWVILRRKKRS